MTKLPRVNSGVTVQQSGKDYFLVDTESGEVFEVNETAARIFSFCQSGSTVDGAVASLAQALSAKGQEAEILEDVHATVRQFQELGLCEAFQS